MQRQRVHNDLGTVKPAKLTEDLRKCTVCDKVAYVTRSAAKAKGGSRGHHRRAYLGDCGWWHMTKLEIWGEKR